MNSMKRINQRIEAMAEFHSNRIDELARQMSSGRVQIVHICGNMSTAIGMMSTERYLKRDRKKIRFITSNIKS